MSDIYFRDNNKKYTIIILKDYLSYPFIRLNMMRILQASRM